MQRRSFLQLAGAGLLGSALHAAERRPPNVVIFIADDLSWHDVACFGGPTDARTPNLDRLASEGVKLTGFFSPASVCSPTRQSLLTGLYPVRNGAYPNHAVVRDGTRSLPHHLKPLGYRTAISGKKHFGPPDSYPFDRFIPMVHDKGGNGDPDMATLERFITADPSKPFCAYIATHEPHGPYTKGDKSAYRPEQLTVPPYLVDTIETRRALASYYAEVGHMDAQVGQVSEVLARTGHTDNTLFLFFSEQGSSMPYGKWTCYDIGIRVAAIARWPGQIEPGTENPALMQYIDVLPTILAANGVDPATIDTGCPDADGKLGFDGRSALDVLLGKTDHLRDEIYAQHTTRGIIKGSEAYGTRAVRDQRHKLIVNLEPEAEFSNAISGGGLLNSWRAKGEAGDEFAKRRAERYTRRPAVELYDLQADPWELNDIAERPENAATVKRLRARLDEWMRQQGDRGDATEREAKEHQARGREE